MNFNFKFYFFKCVNKALCNLQKLRVYGEQFEYITSRYKNTKPFYIRSNKDYYHYNKLKR